MQDKDNKRFSISVTLIAIMPCIIGAIVIIFNKNIGNYDKIYPYNPQQDSMDEELHITNPSDNIHFADPKTKIICLAHWDNNDDGELTYAEAAAATSINDIFKGTDIEVFAELKYFTGLTYISESAFEDCYSLRKIKLPNNISIVEDFAFAECESLRSIHLPNNVTSIGESAFRRCRKLEQITIGENIKNIGTECFAYCKRMSRIYFKGTTPPKGGSDMFEEIHDDKKIYVPTSSLREYRTTQYYMRYMFCIEPWNYTKASEKESELKISYSDIIKLLEID